MKIRINPFLRSALFAPALALVAAPFAHAATIDTTGNTIGTPALFAAGDTYIGNGFLTASGAPGTEIGTTGGNVFGMSGGLITINSGVKVISYNNGTTWNGDLADMQLEGTLDLWDNTNDARIDALNGSSSGLITFGYPWGEPQQRLRLGLDNGSGTYSGSVSPVHFAGNGINIIKSGTGTQTFDNLASQPFRTILIDAGVVDLKNAADVTVGYPISGAGNLTKSGVGVLTLNGSISITGNFTISEGTVSVGTNLTPNINVVIAAGALMNLTGVSTVNSLDIAGSTPLPAGTYNFNHPTYGSYFTGVGSLNILPPTGPNDGIWSLESSGNWSDFSKWEMSTVANTAGKIATFKAITPVTVTLDSNRTIGQLVFEEANHILVSVPGASLTLDNAGPAPSVSVALDKTARITATLASTTGLSKNGDGTLTFASASNISGGTVINGGKLVLENNTVGGSSFNIGSGATLELAFSSGGARTFSNGTIQGGGNLVKTGNSTAYIGANSQTQNISLGETSLIDVQGGLLRNEYGNGNWGANQSDLNVETSASFDIWDANVTVDAINGSGLINKAWSGTHSLTFGVAGGTGTFSGTVSNVTQGYGGAGGDTLNLVKTGAGTQAFTGTTPFRGALSVNQGVLSLGNGNANTSLPDTTPVTVATGAILDLNFTGSDVVASVNLGGTLYTAPGAYNATTYPAFFSGSGSLLIGTDFDIWAINNSVTGGATGDDDNDGVSNNEEYAFGLLPKNGSSVNPIAVPLSGQNFSYTRRNPALTGLTYSVWYSTNLEGWTVDAGAVSGTPVANGDVQTVPVTISAGLLSNPKLFIQVRAQ